MTRIGPCIRCGVRPVAYAGRAFCFECVPRLRKTRPACRRCGARPAAYTGRECCYECVPRARKKPWYCKRCGSDRDYFSAGLCRRCHRQGPVTDSCLDCLAWGVTRRRGWLCEACLGWRRRFGEPGGCPSCRRHVVLNARGYCRLCSRQAHIVRPKHESIDVAEANRFGQQLFFVDLFRQQRPDPPAATARAAHWPARYPVGYRQLVLVEIERDLTAGRLRGVAPPLPDLADAFEQAIAERASRYGWGQGLTLMVTLGMRVLLATQDTPGAPIAYRHVATLKQLPWTSVQPPVEILNGTGMLDDDRERPLETWFDTQTTDLAEPMRAELREWFYAIRDGSTLTPRTRPRRPTTVRAYVAAAMPVLRAWTDGGYESLREISKQDVLDALPTDNADDRAQAITALRSLFRLLKGRRVVFLNPLSRVRSPIRPSTHPLPIDLQPVHEAIDSGHPARAALAALIAFHAPRNEQLRVTRLTDLRNGRLFLPDRTVLLAEPVRQRLSAWLDERGRRWPATINPYLFINKNTAVRTEPVSIAWISQTIGFPAKLIRQDRILDEALASGGDVRRLSDMFGINVKTALRYAHTTDQPDPNRHFSSQTEVPR